MLLLYVDDVLMVGSNTEIIQTLKKALMERFAMKDMSNVSLILGMPIARDRAEGRLKISQEKFVTSILQRFGMSECNPVHTTGTDPELSVTQPDDTLLASEEIKLYQAIVGSVMYLRTCSRFDIIYAVSQLTRAMSKPAKINMTDGSGTSPSIPQGKSRFEY